MNGVSLTLARKTRLRIQDPYAYGLDNWPWGNVSAIRREYNRPEPSCISFRRTSNKLNILCSPYPHSLVSQLLNISGIVGCKGNRTHSTGVSSERTGFRLPRMCAPDPHKIAARGWNDVSATKQESNGQGLVDSSSSGLNSKRLYSYIWHHIILITTSYSDRLLQM